VSFLVEMTQHAVGRPEKRSTRRLLLCFLFCGCWAKRFGTVGVPALASFVCFVARSIPIDIAPKERLASAAFPFSIFFGSFSVPIDGTDDLSIEPSASAVFCELFLRRSWWKRRHTLLVERKSDRQRRLLLCFLFLWGLGQEVRSHRSPCPCFFCFLSTWCPNERLALAAFPFFILFWLVGLRLEETYRYFLLAVATWLWRRRSDPKTRHPFCFPASCLSASYLVPCEAIVPVLLLNNQQRCNP